MKNTATPTANVTLVADGNHLSTPHDLIPAEWVASVGFDWEGKPSDNLLIYYYPSGDVDTISWPNPNPEHLRSALYDARETGFIPDVKSVILPDGSEFFIDEEVKP